jgi:hypothetical protein
VLEALPGRPVRTFPDEGKVFSGGPYSIYDSFHPAVPFQELKDDFDNGHPMVFATPSQAFLPTNAYGLVSSHAFS